MAQRRLRILIGARDRASRVLRAIGRSASALGRRFALVGTAAASLAVVGLGLLIRSQLKTIDSTAKLADILGLTSEQLVGYQRAAELTGVDTNALGKAFARMQKNIGDAVDGLTTAQRAFDKLGVSTDDLLKLNTDEQFKLLADRLIEIEEPAIRTQVALDLFGKAGLQIVKLAEVGSKGLAEFQERTAELGATFNRLDAAKVEAANDALSDMRLAFIGIGRTLAIALAPTIQAFADNTTNAVAGVSRSIRDNMQRAQEFVVRAFTIAEFAVKDWRNVVDLAFTNVSLTIAEFQDDVAISIASGFEIAMFKSREILLRFGVFFDGFLAGLLNIGKRISDGFAKPLAIAILLFKQKAGRITVDELNAALDALPEQFRGLEEFRTKQAQEAAARRINAQGELNKILQENEKEHVRKLGEIAATGESKRTRDLKRRAESLRSATFGLELQETLGRRLAALGEAPELGLLARAAAGLGEPGAADVPVAAGGAARRGAAAVTGRFLTGVQAARREEDRSLTELQELNEKQREANKIADRALLVLEGLSTSVLRGQSLTGSNLEATA